jgi:hypothetical protein
MPGRGAEQLALQLRAGPGGNDLVGRIVGAKHAGELDPTARDAANPQRPGPAAGAPMPGWCGHRAGRAGRGPRHPTQDHDRGLPAAA